MTELVYLNGSLVARDDARIAVLDYGFLYGFGLFETMRAYGGHVFRLDRHLDRLLHSAERLGIVVEGDALERAVTETIRANGLSDARIRLTVSIGEGRVVPDPTTCGEPTVLVVAGNYQPFSEEVYQKGFSAVVSSIRRNSQSPLSGMKTLNFLESMLARQEARTAGADEALLLNEVGLLTEASMSNVFLVGNGSLKTPGLESGVLPGVTRETVLELAGGLGIDAVGCDITMDEFMRADAAFLTNSVMEIMPLTGVEGKPVGSGKPGPVTQKLMTGYREMVRREVGK
ncbi:MAG TPA: aminotransferase class IV [Dehalococcoidales bacterium]|nr:aminotransferase class IV [Dehalococcoidales bacterium]